MGHLWKYSVISSFNIAGRTVREIYTIPCANYPSPLPSYVARMTLRSCHRNRKEMRYYTRNTFSLQSQLQLASTPSSYNDHPHPTTNSVWGSWMYIKCDPPGAGVVDHLQHASQVSAAGLGGLSEEISTHTLHVMS